MVEVTLTLTVDNPDTITQNETTAMVDGFATVMNVNPSQVSLTFQAGFLLKLEHVTVPSRKVHVEAETRPCSCFGIECLSVLDVSLQYLCKVQFDAYPRLDAIKQA